MAATPWLAPPGTSFPSRGICSECNIWFSQLALLRKALRGIIHLQSILGKMPPLPVSPPASILDGKGSYAGFCLIPGGLSPQAEWQRECFTLAHPHCHLWNDGLGQESHGALWFSQACVPRATAWRQFSEIPSKYQEPAATSWVRGEGGQAFTTAKRCVLQRGSSISSLLFHTLPPPESDHVLYFLARVIWESGL